MHSWIRYLAAHAFGACIRGFATSLHAFVDSLPRCACIRRMHSWIRYLAACIRGFATSLRRGEQIAARMYTSKARGERMWSFWTIDEGD